MSLRLILKPTSLVAISMTKDNSFTTAHAYNKSVCGGFLFKPY